MATGGKGKNSRCLMPSRRVRKIPPLKMGQAEWRPSDKLGNMYPFTLLTTQEVHSDKTATFAVEIVAHDAEAGDLKIATQRRRQLQRDMEQQMRNFTSSLPHLPQPDQQRMMAIIERMEKVLAHLRGEEEV